MAQGVKKRSVQKRPRVGAAGSVCLAKPGVPYGTRHPVNFGGLSWDATTINTQEASYPG